MNVQQYVPQEVPAGLHLLRSHLVVTNDDWAAVALVQLCLAAPYVRLVLPQEAIWSTDFSTLPVQSGFDAGNAAKLVTNGDGPPYVEPMRDALPLDTHISVGIMEQTTSDNSYVTLGYGGKTAVIESTILFGQLGESVMYGMTWPQDCGVRGNIVVSDTLTPIVLKRPARYPVGAVCKSLEDDPAVMDLFLQTGLYDAYYFADSKQEKIAIACLAAYRLFGNG